MIEQQIDLIQVPRFTLRLDPMFGESVNEFARSQLRGGVYETGKKSIAVRVSDALRFYPNGRSQRE